MNLQSIGFIGGGRISRLLLQALKQKNTLPEKVLVSDPMKEMRTKIQRIEESCIKCFQKNSDVLNVQVLFLAVHPPVAKEIAAEISSKIPSDTVVVSLLPVLSIEKLFAMFRIPKIVRMIPNAPSLIHKGFNPVVYSDGISVTEKDQLQKLFSNWGAAPEVQEQELEAYAIVTAMGPTYFWFQWLKLKTLAKQFGINETGIDTAMSAMLHGATELLFENNISENEVLDLIPVCPLKDDESTIQTIFETKLIGLHAKLVQK